MTNHERPQRSRELHGVVPGLVVEVRPESEATIDVAGATVRATIAWHDGKVVIDRLTVDRAGADTIDTALLRSISLPELAAAAGDAVRVWVDDAGTEPFDEGRQRDESLEQWAARLAIVAAVTYRSATEYVAQVQGIKESSANQRLVVARKMGLIPPTVATKTKKRKKGRS